MRKETIASEGVRFRVERGGKEIGRAYLYIMYNDLHDKPFGLLEDVYVDPDYRGSGVANELLTAALDEAETRCYKLIATSRNDGTRESVHEWYLRLGFQNYGTEFRINF